MSLFEKFYCDSDDGEDEDEEEEEVAQGKEEPQPQLQPTFTASLDDAWRVERKDLLNNHQSHKAKELQEMKDAILTFLYGAQDRLKGCKTTAPVYAFIRERIEATVPFFYLSGNRPLTKEGWMYIQNNVNSIIRILHNTFNPYAYPADLLLNEYSGVLVRMYSDVAAKLRREFLSRATTNICAELGSNSQEVANFVLTNPEAELNDRRLMQRVAEKLDFVGEGDFVRDMLNALPPGIMTLSAKSLEDQLGAVTISDSRENSPERERRPAERNEDEADEEEEDDIGPLELYFSPPPLPTRSVAKQRAVHSILKEAGNTWYRSDNIPVKNIPLLGRVTYSEYSANKKKVAFKSLDPTECFVYYIDRMVRHLPLRCDFIPRTGHTWGFKTSFEDFERMERYPNLDRDLRSSSSAHTCGVLPSRIGKLSSKKEKGAATLELWKRLFPTQFLKSVPLRDNIYKGMGGTAREIPAHAEKRERDLGQIKNTDILLKYYYERMVGFEKHWLYINPKIDQLRHKHVNAYGILILTDSVFEDVNPATLLNAALFPFPPPMEYSYAVNILIDHWESTDGIHDVILSWGFEQLIIEREYTEAFASLLLFAFEVRAVLEENMKRIATERSEWDVVEVPKIWLFTIPEGTYRDAELFKKYNNLVRKFCDDEPDFHLIDWALAWYDAPSQFAFPEEDGVSVAERTLQLFFRMCREKMDLLYRRPANERRSRVERGNLGSRGLGPWLKDIYEIFEDTGEVRQEEDTTSTSVKVEPGQEENISIPWEETMETTPQFSHPDIQSFKPKTRTIKTEPVS